MRAKCPKCNRWFEFNGEFKCRYCGWKTEKGKCKVCGGTN